MAVIRCDNGHYYDGEKYTDCPHCNDILPVNSRRGLSDAYTVLGSSLTDIATGAVERQHIQVDLSGPKSGLEDEKTVGLYHTEKGYDPVVGWFVCVSGQEKGRDFRLHSGRNFIGRALKSDIALVDDERISRQDHCSVIFEPKQNIFMLARGQGDGVLVNGQRMHDSWVLLGEEAIEIGASTFVFIPFCREGRIW